MVDMQRLVCALTVRVKINRIRRVKMIGRLRWAIWLYGSSDAVTAEEGEIFELDCEERHALDLLLEHEERTGKSSPRGVDTFECNEGLLWSACLGVDPHTGLYRVVLSCQELEVFGATLPLEGVEQACARLVNEAVNHSSLLEVH